MLLKVKFLLVAVFILLFSTANAETFPAVKAPSLNEDSLLLDVQKLKAPVVLVNFWASWCGICKSEMKDFFNLVQEFEGNVQFVAISTDDVRSDALPVYENFKMSIPQQSAEDVFWLWDKDKKISLGVFNIIRVPETYILYKSGNSYEIHTKIVGKYKWSSPKTYKMIKSLLHKKKGA